MSIPFLTKLRDLVQREARLPFFRQIDLYRIENGVLIGVSGVLGAGFVIDPRDLLLQGDEAILDLENRTRKFLNALPEGATFHFIVKAGEEGEASLQSYRDFLAGGDMLSRALADSKARFWRQHPFFKKDLFLFVTAVTLLIAALILFAFPLRGNRLKAIKNQILEMHLEKHEKLEALEN